MLSEDPIRSGTNWYVYCYNNPIKYIDPSGLIGIKPDGTIYMDETDTEIDRKLLQLKIDYENADGLFQKDIIARAARKIRNENIGNYKVMAEHTLDSYRIPDVSLAMNTIIHNREAEFEQIDGDLVQFKEAVKTGSMIDVKNTNDTFKRNHYSYHIIFNGEVMRADAPGNILFGYFGTAAGIGDVVLLTGAGVFQVIDGPRKIEWIFRYGGDAPGDGNQIMYGIEMYYRNH